jgi:CoA-disulfide reductase
MKRNIVIVGGVAGGATAAARLRRLDEHANIIMIERGEHISFANCGLPYYIGGVIPNRSSLLVQTVQGMSERFQIDIRNLQEVTGINRSDKKVRIRNLRTGEVYDQPYDLLLLSPGAKPIRPPIPGIEACDNLFALRNIPDTDKIKTYMDTAQPKRAVVIGGGFIGVEMAENLREQGLEVSLVEQGKQMMGTIDPEMAAILHRHMEEHGVRLVLGQSVTGFEKQGRTIQLSDGSSLESDLTILAIGVQPESNLAQEAGLELGQRGAIRVNESMQTSDPSIYAVGDAVEVMEFVTKTPAVIPLAGPANRQARIAADHMCGRAASYKGTQGTSVAKVFELTVASTGASEKTLQRLELPYQAVHLHPGSHAGYYPGAASISLKLLFDPTNGKVLGAQAIGADGADKRIDVVATAIRAGFTVHDLTELELSYAPPYSSAKDPVNMAGYIASNIVDGLSEVVQWNQLHDELQRGAYLIDVREAVERELGYIDGSVNIPLGQLRSRLNEIPKNRDIIVSCQVGLRGYVAARLLAQHDFQVRNLDGGYKTYSFAHSKNVDAPSASAAPVQASKVDDTGVSIQDELAAPTVSLDVTGLQCPGPIMKVYEAMGQLKHGDILEVRATDSGFARDIAMWCSKMGHELLSSDKHGISHVVTIRRGAKQESAPLAITCSSASDNGTIAAAGSHKTEGATMVVFSGDMDKAMASFIIASGAAAMGKPVTMFFTFWGLNILRRTEAPPVHKDIVEKMFGAMMPKGTSKLPISKMNMWGMGPKMIQYAMKRKNVDSLDKLMQGALAAGVKLVACTMSMDIMGIKPEELIDGVDFGGVATYLGHAEDSGLNLFI